MPSTQSLSASAKVEPVNEQPPPALSMSTDSNGPEPAMRLRGGCFVRHSNAVPIRIAYAFSRISVGIAVGSADVIYVFEKEMMQPAMRHRCVLCVIPEFQLLIRILGRHPFRVAVE